MEIILIIIGFILIAVFWEYLLAGIGGAIVFGIIGAFFGIAPITAIIGFILTAIGHYIEKKENNSNDKEKTYQEDQEKNHKAYEKTFEKEKIYQEQKYVKEKKQNDIRIISCPSCKQKIRVLLPLSGNIGKCIRCKSQFEIYIDNNNNTYINQISSTKNTHKNEIENIDDCFIFLEVEEKSSSQQIKRAYKKKMMEYHPDKVEKLGEKLKKVAEIESRNLNTAYSLLKEYGYV